MATVRVYSTAFCPYCVMAKRLLDGKGVAYEEIRVDQDLERRDEMMQLSGRRTVPQIFVGQTHVGGFDDLSALDRAGGLDPLLAANA
ncbi:glutaredoxin 3 [Hydrocarboniphaga daqingensis]|uniref:Glutaredoxin n=1 Tax=Hydrocarboniphaga daqingensis TaxID=490188 RepID=A0A1M5LCZ1_9GAMM|nr:glutaredoxin 3 [Hydrocarboniphaga daqingensis]SHG62559.1 glutaredoxin 3 [Hydrocarboniphaga daqingensis]